MYNVKKIKKEVINMAANIQRFKKLRGKRYEKIY